MKSHIRRKFEDWLYGLVGYSIRAEHIPEELSKNPEAMEWIEAAFRAGYEDGYDDGNNDADVQAALNAGPRFL